MVVSIVFLPNARLRCARRRDALIVADVTLGYFFANVHGRRGSAHTQRTYVVWGGRRRGVVVRTRQHSGRQSSGAGQTPPEINRIGESLKIFTNRFANTRAGVCVRRHLYAFRCLSTAVAFPSWAGKLARCCLVIFFDATANVVFGCFFLLLSTGPLVPFRWIHRWGGLQHREQRGKVVGKIHSAKTNQCERTNEWYTRPCQARM